MANFARKVLWIVGMDAASEKRLLDHAKKARMDAVCIRTDNRILPQAIKRFQAQGLKVYGWRWPAVIPKPNSTTHYYAADEARYVAGTLIPAGLDGYIIDPESDRGSPSNDWNKGGLETLARDFCNTIRTAGGRQFAFGVTSGCDYATSKKKMPWSILADASDALFPQAYWRWTNPVTGRKQNINGGTPDKAMDRGLASWRKLPGRKPIIPMSGEIDVIDAEEIPAYAARVRAEGGDQYHFYTDGSAVAEAKLTVIGAI
jgi:hypothetical protein